MSFNPKVSIITPTYNHENLIADCINSVQDQTYTNWEMIIVDDGSTDHTKYVIEKFLSDPRIKYIYQDNKGPQFLSETYNLALKHSTGNLVAILEGDDYWPNNKLEMQVPAFEDPEVVLCFGDYLVTDVNGELKIPIRYNHLPKSIVNNDPIGEASLFMLKGNGGTFTFPVTVVIKKEALQQIGGFIQCTRVPIVDYSTFIHLGLIGKFHYVDGVMGYWRRRISSITSTNRISIYNGVLEYGKEFFHAHRTHPVFSKSNWDEIVRTWKNQYAIAYLEKGRVELLQQKWPSARKSFSKVLSNRKTFIKGIIGISFSLFRRDLETIYKRKNGYNLFDLMEKK